SFETLLRIQQWAQGRVVRGGSRVTIRLVKGANMEMERVEASIRGWPQAPYKKKLETDANYRRMLHQLLKPESLAAIDIGLASHNLFDLAYGLVLALEQGALGQVQFEMLEGMANHQRRALYELSKNLLLYAPACKKEDFINAIGYLIRRLDENTGPENFLRHAFKLKVPSPEWDQLEKGFLEALARVQDGGVAPRRTQDRRQAPPETSPAIHRGWQHFMNEPDTDFALPQNGEWAQQIIAKWEPLSDENAPQIPLVVAGEEIFDQRAINDCLDPSRPGMVVGRYSRATESDIHRAVECASADPSGWRDLPFHEQFKILGRVALEIRKARADLVGAALANGGKTLSESDPEVSEAVDFLEFYRDTARWWREMPTLKASPKGVVVVVPPWNFPIAIPCGGVAAALAAGNTVILKPASDTVLIAWELCQCFWRAGVPKQALQFLPCSGGQEGRKLVNHPEVDAVILTGGTATAQTMLHDNPRLCLFAETGGKNATIVTALSDRDQAIKHVLHSAFSHSGQKCSATSLLLLEAEVYDDPHFRQTLCDAVQSMKVGSAWELETKMGPLIRPPTGDLENALKVLEPGEEWAVIPRHVDGNPNLWSPGVKYGVQPGSYTHLTEFFGPVLGVMRFQSLREAVALVHQTGYGLTSGLESLDEREWDYWLEHLRAGNLYLNRVTTGAVVLRQPFGGFGKSVFGPGMKTGSSNYVAQFMNFEDAAQPSASELSMNPILKELGLGLRASAAESELTKLEAEKIVTAATSYAQSQLNEFSVKHDHFQLVGQDNFRRYLPFPEIRVRVHPEDSSFDLFARVCAAHAAGCRITMSVPPNFSSPALQLLESLTQPWAGRIEFVHESDEELAQAMRDRQTDRVRYADPKRVPLEILKASAESGICAVSVPVSSEGRLEMLWYVQEQSISIDYHRYGNLGQRASESRSEPS
ncbi:MAG: Aldehyde dehydrogenase, partial [Verrucomicrobiales bacterium]|nr:Aldehyde dehydrogenase [Verrucomicrobiales bacterium]